MVPSLVARVRAETRTRDAESLLRIAYIEQHRGHASNNSTSICLMSLFDMNYEHAYDTQNMP
jgi:hypothetical protein